MRFQKEISTIGKISCIIPRILNTMDTLSAYISTTDWDIGMNQKMNSMAWFPLSSRILRIFGVDGRLIETCGSGV